MTEINVKRMSQIDFCIIVYWIHGLSIGKIYKSFGQRMGKSEGAIRGITSRLPRSRSEMSRADRQKMLQHLKDARIDDGMLPDFLFEAKPTPTDRRVMKDPRPKKPKPVPVDLDGDLDLSTAAGRKEQKRRRLERQKKDAIQASKDEDMLRNGGAPRGILCAAFEYMCGKDLLADPGEVKGALRKKGSPSLMRQSVGQRLRPILESLYGSGLKTQSFDGSFGGSGAGVVIHARVSENVADVNRLREMMGTDEFNQLDNLLRQDKFIWMVPSKNAQKLILDDIRRSLDCALVYYGEIKSQDFKTRWGFEPNVTPSARRSEIRKANRETQDSILKAQRQAR